MKTDTPKATPMEEPVTTVDQPAADAMMREREKPNPIPMSPPTMEMRTA